MYKEISDDVYFSMHRDISDVPMTSRALSGDSEEFNDFFKELTAVMNDAKTALIQYKLAKSSEEAANALYEKGVKQRANMMKYLEQKVHLTKKEIEAICDGGEI